jgi:hypothetical protein
VKADCGIKESYKEIQFVACQIRLSGPFNLEVATYEMENWTLSLVIDGFNAH